MAKVDWVRDELILALDVYFSEPKAIGSKTHPAVFELSALLRSMPIYPLAYRKPTFRNANGVGMKLSNFLRFDPSYSGKGLGSGNEIEREVWEEFANDRKRLSKVAAAIREAAASKVPIVEQEPEEDEMDAPEGKLLTQLHKRRERSRKLVARKKEQVLHKTNKLACEGCGFDFFERYGEVGKGFIECHHILPISAMGDLHRTKLEHLVVVCSNCHRMIHRRRPWLSIEELRAALESYSLHARPV